MKISTCFKTLAVAMALTAIPAGAQADVETLLEESFDDATHFTQSTTVPDGWLSTGTYAFARNTGSYFGQGAHSGNYVFGTLANSSSMSRDELVCTPMISMKAGEEYTISFWYKAPGGMSSVFTTSILTKVGTSQAYTSLTETLGQTPTQQVTDWTQASYTFTPTVDGSYCFGFNLLTQLYNSGAVVIDDVTVTGPSAGIDTPEDKVVCELPYSQSFDNENGDYDGTTYVPKGWLASGSAPFTTANIDDLAAKDGTYYAIAPESTVARDDRLYTSFFHLEAGGTYVAKFWLYMPGDGENSSNFDFTVGTEQDAEFHESLYSLTSYTNTGWVEHTVTFQPEETDYYCFAFALSGELANAGEVCVDLFTLTEEGKVTKPVTAFSYQGAFNVMNSNVLAFKNTRLQMVNLTTGADSYLWEVTGPVSFTSTQADPYFVFSTDGDYNIKLTSTNAAGTTSAQETVSVQTVADDAQQVPVSVYNSNSDKLWGRSAMPSFDTAVGSDFVTGVNHYYTNFAEFYNLPEGHKYEITSLTLYLCYYNLASRYYSQQAAKDWRLVAYGVKDGRPDLDNVFGTCETTMQGAFGTTGLSEAEMRGITLSSPITAQGPFFLAFEFGDGLWLDDPDANLSRTVLGLGGVEHKTQKSTFFVQPTALPEGATATVDGQYCPIDEVDATYKGVGLNLTLWVNLQVDSTVSSVALNRDGQTVFALRHDGQTLTVSGTHAGDTVSVLNAAGQTVAAVPADELSTTFALPLRPGLYIVSTEAGTRKIVVK